MSWFDKLSRPWAAVQAKTDGRDAGFSGLDIALGLPGLTNSLGMADVLRLSAVVACLDVVSQDIGKTPMYMYRREGAGKKRVLPAEHPIAKMLNLKINTFQTRSEFFSQLVFNLRLWNNAYIVERKAADDSLAGLYVAPTAQTIIGTTSAGNLAYRVSLGTDVQRSLWRGVPTDVPERLMLHLRQRSIAGIGGISSLTVGANYFELSKRLNEYRERLYKAEGTTNGVFEMREGSGELSDEAFTRLQRQLRDDYKSFRRGEKPLLLEGGLTHKSTSLDAGAAQVKDALERELTDACRLFRVPPFKIAALSDTKYEGAEVAERAYASDALDPTMVDIELAFAARLLTEEEQDEFFFEFDRDRLQVVDMKTRIEKACQLFESGLIDDNEGRERIGMNPRPDNLRVIRGNQAVVGDDNAVTYPGRGESVRDT